MWLRRLPVLALAIGLPLLMNCSSSSNNGSASSALEGDAAAACFPDTDGVNGGSYTIDVVVTDTGFFNGTPDSGADIEAGTKGGIATQNDAMITFTLTNTGTTPHGFEVECTPVSGNSLYANLPSYCPTTACFASLGLDAGPDCQNFQGLCIPPIAPGASITVVFDTPTPDGLLYPYKSSAPADSAIPGLNGSGGVGWLLM